MPDAFITPAPHGANARISRAVVLALFGPWRPPPGQTLAVAERVRVALMRASEGDVPGQISGKDREGRPRVGHEHLYILPYASAGSGAEALDRVLLWARRGLEPGTRAVIEELTDHGGWIRVGRNPAVRLERLGGEAPGRLLGPARVWHSVTGFAPPRHMKRRGGQMLDTPEQQLARLCEVVLGRSPRVIEPCPGFAERCVGAIERRTKDRGGRAGMRSSGWTLRFDEAVAGPIALGYGAHFGLGQFEAEVGR